MYLIFDTETTGLPKNWKAPISDTENWPRCVQLAWQVHDELGNLIESKSYIVKPDDYDIPFESEKIHGISTLLAEKEGINLDDILNLNQATLDRYSKERSMRNLQMTWIIQSLYGAFGNANELGSLLLKSGMGMLDKMPVVKQKIIDFANRN